MSAEADARDEQRVALVTGGSRGIGRAISLELGRLGYHVFINFAHDQAAAESTRAAIEALGGTAAIIKADVAERADVKNMFREIRRARRRLDVLVNNAGILHEELFFFTSVDRFWELMKVNLGGVVNCCKAAIPLLGKRRAGRIINVASIAALHGTAGLSAYASSKAAVLGLTKVLARELGPMGVVVNAVAPGLIETDMTAELAGADTRERAVAQQPIARLGRAEEVASVVAYLADQAPEFMTGEIVRVDGGSMIG